MANAKANAIAKTLPVCFHPGPLQPDLPRGRTRNGPIARKISRSPTAHGERTSFRKPGEGATKRAAEDSYAKFKYDATADQDNLIIGRVANWKTWCDHDRGISGTRSQRHHLCRRNKFHHIEGAAKAVIGADQRGAYLSGRAVCTTPLQA